jgi:hypothetical protein
MKYCPGGHFNIGHYYAHPRFYWAVNKIQIPFVRRVWRYQRVNQNPYIEEEQTTQWLKEKGQKDKQRSTKHTCKTTERWMSQMEQELLTLPEHPSSPPFQWGSWNSMFGFLWSALQIAVCPFGNRVVCLFLICVFWLPRWNRQTLLKIIM